MWITLPPPLISNQPTAQPKSVINTKTSNTQNTTSLLSKAERLEHKIAKNQWNSDAWLSLLQETKDYPRFLKQFPTSVYNKCLF